MTSPTTERRRGLLGSTGFKAPVTALAASNITLSGEQTIDGKALLAINAAGVPDRVLCTAQTDATQNGVWDVSTGAWTRSLDANQNYDFKKGTTVVITDGSTYAGTYWNVTAAAPITLGTTLMTWARALASSISTLSFLQAGTGAVSRGAQDKMRDVVSVFDFIPTALQPAIQARTSTTDVTTYIQAGIDALLAVGGGVLYFPYGQYVCANVVLKNGVELTSFMSGFGYLPSSISGVTLKAAATGVIVDTPAAGTGNCGVSGINFLGLGAGTACVGVRFQNVSWGWVKNCGFRSFADQAILKNAGAACVFEDILALESLLNRTRSSKNGVVQAAGTDDFLNRVEANAFLSAGVTSANLYVCAIAYLGSNAFITNCVGEFADVGVHIGTGTLLNRMVNVRADTNQGHGFEILGSAHQVIGCYGQKNSQATANTYDQFNVSGTGCIFADCSANLQGGLAPRYSFNDTFNGETGKNFWSNCRSSGATTAEYNNDAFAGSGFDFGQHPGIRIASTTTTPTVTGLSRIALNNLAPTTITNLLGGVNGQVVDLQVTDDNTTISSGAGFSLYGAISMKLRSNSTYRFYKDGANWVWEDFRNRPVMGADVGDAGVTLTVISSANTQLWDTPLTAPRAVGLSTSAARSGDKFRIVRSANATGASALNVGTGPLKALAVGQWCDVEYTGAAWALTATGSL